VSAGTTPTAHVRVASGFGEVGRDAQLLVGIADLANAVVHLDFNGDDLIARPGQDWHDVHQDWVQRRHARQTADKGRVARLAGAGT
jgi:hypothetical protein